MPHGFEAIRQEKVIDQVVEFGNVAFQTSAYARYGLERDALS